MNAYNGQVTLIGHALSDEIDKLLAAVHKVPGVKSVDNQMSVHDTAGNIPSLQGEGRLRT